MRVKSVRRGGLGLSAGKMMGRTRGGVGGLGGLKWGGGGLGRGT